MSRIQYDQDHVSVPKELVDALQKGADMYVFFHSPAYKRVVDWFEHKCEEKLAHIRQSRSDDDRLNSNLLLLWKDREELMREFQIEVQAAIAERTAVAAELQDSGIQLDDVIDFN